MDHAKEIAWIIQGLIALHYQNEAGLLTHSNNKSDEEIQSETQEIPDQKLGLFNNQNIKKIQNLENIQNNKYHFINFME